MSEQCNCPLCRGDDVKLNVRVKNVNNEHGAFATELKGSDEDIISMFIKVFSNNHNYMAVALHAISGAELYQNMLGDVAEPIDLLQNAPPFDGDIIYCIKKEQGHMGAEIKGPASMARLSSRAVDSLLPACRSTPGRPR